jgi:hypothetical protein
MNGRELLVCVKCGETVDLERLRILASDRKVSISSRLLVGCPKGGTFHEFQAATAAKGGKR